MPKTVTMLVVAVGFMVMFLSSSLKGAYQVYFLDLAEVLHVGCGAVGLGGGLFGLVLGLASPFVGRLCDRFGAYTSLIAGSAVAAMSFLVLGVTQSYSGFLFGYSLLAAYAMASLTFVPVGMMIDQSIPERHRSFAYALTTNGTSIGFIVLSPLWVWLNGWMSWPTLMLTLSLLFVCVLTLPLMGLKRQVQPAACRRTHTAPSPSFARVSQYVRQPLFLVLAVSFSGCGAAMAFIDIHLVPLIHERLGMQAGGHALAQVTTASTLSVLGVLELAGCLLVGLVADRVNNTVLLSLLYAIRIVAMIMLLYAHDAWVFIGFGILFGATYMGTVIVTSMTCLRAYGEVRGTMFGLLFLCHQVAVFAVAWLGGVLHDALQSYDAIIVVIAIISGVSAVAALFLGRSVRMTQRQAHLT